MNFNIWRKGESALKYTRSRIHYELCANDNSIVRVAKSYQLLLVFFRSYSLSHLQIPIMLLSRATTNFAIFGFISSISVAYPTEQIRDSVAFERKRYGIARG
jgi:hypothetical protein